MSPYLFVLAAEILAETIRSKSEIKGLTIYKHEHKTSLYADDTTLFLKPHEKNIRGCMQILKEFEQVSGLKVNKEKTKVAKIGTWGDDRTTLCNDLKLEWTQEFTSLGILYNLNEFDRITDINVQLKMTEIEKSINLWNARNLTPYGKIVVIKSLLVSKIIHVLLSLPSPNSDTLERLELVFREFIWNKKTPKFRGEILETLPNLGGLKMTNLTNFAAALKISWIKRIQDQTIGWAEFPIQHRITDILKYGDLFPQKIESKIKNKFWKNVVQSIKKLNTCLDLKKHTFIQSMPLWYNSLLNVEFRKNWEEKGINVLRDILDENGNLIKMEVMHQRGVTIHFLDYLKIGHSVGSLQVNRNTYCTQIGPNLPRLLVEIDWNKKRVQ